MRESRSSRLPALHRLSPDERLALLARHADLSETEQALLADGNGLGREQAGQMIENAISVYGLPLGIAPNFIINGRELLVPLAIEEPSVVAALGNAARIFRAGGGFCASSDEPLMNRPDSAARRPRRRGSAVSHPGEESGVACARR